MPIKHKKTNTVPAWTQTDLDAAIAAGTVPPGTTLAGFTLSTDWNDDHIISGDLGPLDSITLTPTGTPVYAPGKLVYDSTNESLTFYNNDSNVALQVGQEEWIRVRNNTGSTIANGQAVYLNGASGGLPTIALAQSNAGATTVCAGLTTETIANGAIGYVTCIGSVRNVDTSAFTAGQTVYLSSSVAGGLQNTAPVAPNYRYRIGIVGTSSATVGTIHVTPSTADLGLGTANQIRGVNAAGTASEFKSIVAGANITINHSTGQIEIVATTGVGTITDIYPSSGTWTKRAGLTQIEAWGFGAGGGGGSGRKGALGVIRGGGGAGAPGSVTVCKFPASYLSGTEAVTVGGGGTGGAAQLTDSTDGIAGTAGGTSSLGTKFFAYGGGGGGAGTVSAGGVAGVLTFATVTPENFLQKASTAGTTGAVLGAAGASADLSPPGSGGGCGVAASNVGQAGGAGANRAQAANPRGATMSALGGTGGSINGVTNGTSGAISSFTFYGLPLAGGSGGGGGRASATLKGTDGADGVGLGNGGGGGGAGTDGGVSSGKGGNGYDGCIVIINYF